MDDDTLVVLSGNVVDFDGNGQEMLVAGNTRTPFSGSFDCKQ